MKYSPNALKHPKVGDAGSLTPAEAAEAMGVSLSTVWRQMRRGELASYKVGNRRLIPSDAIRRPPEDGLRLLTPDHPIWALAGAGKSGGAGPGSSDKYFYLTGARRRRSR
jgi:excisionase family DNA binding protein